MRYVYQVVGIAGILVENLIKILPEKILVQVEDGNYFLTCESNPGTNEKDAFFLLQKEMDRLHFLTGRDIHYTLRSIENDDGSFVGVENLKCMLNAVAKLPNDVIRQEWIASNISIQLRLWSLSSEDRLPLAAKINLLFQIIEIDFPDTRDATVYPVYDDPTLPPSSKTESKLLRDLMSHGNSPVAGIQLQRYCTFLGIPVEMHDPTSPVFLANVRQRFSVLQEEARQIITSKISKA